MNAKVSSSDNKMTFRRILVTPQIAEGFLANTPEFQRSLNNNLVNSYADEMKAGRWQETGDTIKIDDEGKLLDGQHRLHAIIASGKQQWMVLAKGIEPEAFSSIDIGRKRTPGDMFSIAGYSQAIGTAAVTRMLVSCEYSHRSGVVSIRKPTPEQMLQYAAKHKKEVELAVEIYCGIRKYATSAASIAAALAYLHRYAPEEAAAFTAKIVDGADLKQKTPALVLRNHLMEQDGAGHSISCRRIAEVVVMFGAYVRGMETSKMIAINEDDTGSLVMPIVHVDKTTAVDASGRRTGASAAMEQRSRARAKRGKPKAKGH